MEKLPISIYTAPSWEITVDVLHDNNSLWLNEQQIADIFEVERSVINKHINNVFKTAELSQEWVRAFFAHVQKEGVRTIKRNIAFYNLDMIISVW